MMTDRCDDHDWVFDDGDSCPECDGAVRERKRIIDMLVASSYASTDNCQGDTINWIIGLIRGEQK